MTDGEGEDEGEREAGRDNRAHAAGGAPERRRRAATAAGTSQASGRHRVWAVSVLLSGPHLNAQPFVCLLA